MTYSSSGTLGFVPQVASLKGRVCLKLIPYLAVVFTEYPEEKREDWFSNEGFFTHGPRREVLLCIALHVTFNCICEIHCLPLDLFNLITVHKLSSKENKSRRSRDLNTGLLGGKHPPSSERLHVVAVSANLSRELKSREWETPWCELLMTEP